jgi:voltage-gated potassium channel
MNTKIEIFVASITIVSVVVILFQQFAQPTGTTLTAIYIFDFIVVIILIADFYFRMKESKEGIKFVIKHFYEIPAMIPLFVF